MFKIDFPVGYQQFHKNKMFNFQLNRWYSMGYADLAALKDAASRITDVASWQHELEALSDKALEERNFMQAAFYLRGADFLADLKDPKKAIYYEKIQEYFKKMLPVDFPIEWVEVPFEDGYLPAYQIKSLVEEKKGDLVIHGGYDSYKEELFSIALYFANAGYEVYLFDGPGQGGAIKKYGLTMNYKWEEPVSAVLDHFKLDDVTLLGISMGGWLCFRAAANDDRIKRVIASSVAYDYSQLGPKALVNFSKWMLKHERVTNWISRQQMKMIPSEKWRIENLMYITGTKSPVESGWALYSFNAEHIQADKVKQDVLILTGEKDHMAPMKLHHLQVAALTNAKSITPRIFSAAEHAENHCQVGNLGLALKTMEEWIEAKTKQQDFSPKVELSFLGNMGIYLGVILLFS